MAGERSISEQLDKILTEFEDDTSHTLDAAIKKAANKCKRDVKSASPGEGKYAGGWTVADNGGGVLIGKVVYNKSLPGLTQLTEKSHVVKNKYGSYGRTSPGHGQTIHIAPAAEAAEEYLIKLLEKEL